MSVLSTHEKILLRQQYLIVLLIHELPVCVVCSAVGFVADWTLPVGDVVAAAKAIAEDPLKYESRRTSVAQLDGKLHWC